MYVFPYRERVIVRARVREGLLVRHVHEVALLQQPLAERHGGRARYAEVPLHPVARVSTCEQLSKDKARRKTMTKEEKDKGEW